MKPPINRLETSSVEKRQGLRGARRASFRRRAFAIVAALCGANTADRGISITLGGPIELEDACGAVLSTARLNLTTDFSNGRPIGTHTFGICGVSLVHERISFWHCLDRALGYALYPVVAGLGFRQHCTRPKRQTIHDRPAQTIAVRLPRHALDAT